MQDRWIQPAIFVTGLVVATILISGASIPIGVLIGILGALLTYALYWAVDQIGRGDR